MVDLPTKWASSWVLRTLSQRNTPLRLLEHPRPDATAVLDNFSNILLSIDTNAEDDDSKSESRNGSCQTCGAKRRQGWGMSFSARADPGVLIRKSVLFQDLRDNREKCYVCRILATGILTFARQNKLLDKSDFTSVQIDCWPGEHCKVLVRGFSEAARESKALILFRYKCVFNFNNLTTSSYLPMGCQPVLDYGWQTTRAIINVWISDCEKLHGAFKNSAPLLPSRVLDVGYEGNVIHLLQREQECGHYTALSHCWGQKQILTTTSKNLQERVDGMSLEDLPKTFRDAVLITRLLSIRYLWIDSLCILQDSPQDWERESSAMGDIYSKSYVTIAAAAANDSSQGCFFSNPPSRQTVGIKVSTETEVVAKVFVGRQTDAESGPGFHGELPRHLLSMPLCTRGWTMQELLLSPHILYFTGDDIFWECERGLQCHCPTQHVFEIGGMKSMLLNSKTKIEEAQTSDANPQNRFKEWRNLVENYSALLLTHQSDKLPALSGLARRHHSFHTAQYLAGLWGPELLIDLFWSRSLVPPNVLEDLSLVRTTRPCPASAPTWSWASIHGAVDWKNKQLPTKFEQPATVISAVCELGENPWGQPLRGALKLKGKMLSVSIYQVRADESSAIRCQITVRTKFRSRDWMFPEQDAILDTLDFTDNDRFVAFRLGVRSVPFETESSRAKQQQVEEGLSPSDDFLIDYVIHYYLLLKRVSRLNRSFERMGVFIKHVRRGEEWDPGTDSVVTII